MNSQALEAHSVPSARLVATDGQTFPLRAAHLGARVEGGFAHSTLTQSFHNPHAETLEVKYTLPLPADGAVVAYTVRMGERVIRAEVQSRERASRAYLEALYEGRTASLLEQTRTDTFQQSLGNVPANTDVEVTIEVLHPLAWVGGAELPAHEPVLGSETRITSPGGGTRECRWEYRFPTVVGIRYAGAPGRVNDQQQLSPDRDGVGGIPLRMTFQLVIPSPANRDSGAEVDRKVSSPSHAFQLERAQGSIVVSFREGERLDRDVVVSWSGASAALGTTVVVGSGLDGDDGRYGLVTITPPEAPTTTGSRDLTILLDASGSMEGLPLALAKRIIGDLLRSLSHGDRFELLAFSNECRDLTKGLRAADPGEIGKALEALARVAAGGGTEMESALAKALDAKRGEAQRQVVLVTDGYVSFEHEVVAVACGARNVRVHAAGVGSAPVRALTCALAAAGRGVEILASDEASAAEGAKRLIAGTARPVLVGVSVSGTAVVGDLVPGRRDVFAAQPLSIPVELSRSGGTLNLVGKLAGTGEHWTHVVQVPAVDGTSGPALPSSALPLGAIYGRELIAWLEQQRAADRGNRAFDMDARIERAGLRHRLASSRTSLVAIAETSSVDPSQPWRRERLAVEMPYGVSAAGVGMEEVHYFSSASASHDRSPRSSRPLLAAPFLDLFSEMRSRLRPAPLPVLEAVAFWTDDGKLVLEVTTPAGSDELDPPNEEARILPMGHERKARLVKATSSGPTSKLKPGLTVRIVLTFASPPAWHEGDLLMVGWVGTPYTLECKCPPRA